jgi:hypothetical protein
MACSKHGKYEIFIENIRWEPEGKLPLENLGSDGRIILEHTPIYVA